MSLPIFQTDDQSTMLLQTSWSASINPLLKAPLLNGVQLKSVPLTIGSNTIDHKLGRKLQGWVITRKRAAADIYDTQDTNLKTELHLMLNSSAACTVDIYVY